MTEQEFKLRLPGLPKPEMTPVKSSQIQSLGYLPEAQVLFVKFTYGGAVYAYCNVLPEAYEALKNSPSVGQFFSQRIKLYPHLFPFVKIDS